MQNRAHDAIFRLRRMGFAFLVLAVGSVASVWGPIGNYTEWDPRGSYSFAGIFGLLAGLCWMGVWQKKEKNL